MKLQPIIDAIAVLRQVKALPTSATPGDLWIEAVRALGGLEYALEQERIEVPVEKAGEPKVSGLMMSTDDWLRTQSKMKSSDLQNTRYDPRA